MLNFLTPYLTYMKLALGVALGIALFVAGYALSNHFSQKTIADLNQSLGEYKSAYLSLAVTTQDQNDAINKLNSEAADREKAAAAAQERAKEALIAAQRRAAAILGQKRPTGHNLCEAASQAFDDELKAERGIK